MPNVDHVRFEELLADGGQGALDWMYRLANAWGLTPSRPQFELMVTNPKHPGELFNCTQCVNVFFFNVFFSHSPAGVIE